MTPFPYRVTVRWSEPDGAYVAEVPAIRGAAGDGETLEAAVRAAQESATELLEVKNECGDPIPPSDLKDEDYSGQTRIRMPRSLHRELAKAAKDEGVSLNQLMVTYLARQVGFEQGSTGSVGEKVSLNAERFRVFGRDLISLGESQALARQVAEHTRRSVLFAVEGAADYATVWNLKSDPLSGRHFHIIPSRAAPYFFAMDFLEVLSTASSGPESIEIPKEPSGPESSETDRTKVQ